MLDELTNFYFPQFKFIYAVYEKTSRFINITSNYNRKLDESITSNQGKAFVLAAKLFIRYCKYIEDYSAVLESA